MNFGNLGIAMGAGVDEMHKQRISDREDEAAAQRKTEFGRKQKEWATQDDLEKRQKEISDWYSGSIGRLEQGDHNGVADELSGYHNATNYLGDSKSRTFDGANGKKYVAEFPVGEGQGMPRLHEVTPELTRAQLENVYRHRMEQVDPRQALAHMDKAREFSLKDRAATAEATKAGAAMRNADTMEGYRQYQENEPQRVQLGNGQVGMFKGEKFLGAYGPARPDHGGGGAASQMGTLLGPTKDGTGLLYNTPNGVVVKPLPAGADVAHLFPKATGLKPLQDPATRKEYMMSLKELGPQPQPVNNWLGNVANQRQIDGWKANRAYLDEAFGVTAEDRVPNSSAPVLPPPAPQAEHRPNLQVSEAPQGTGLTFGNIMVPRNQR